MKLRSVGKLPAILLCLLALAATGPVMAQKPTQPAQATGQNAAQPAQKVAPAQSGQNATQPAAKTAPATKAAPAKTEAAK